MRPDEARDVDPGAAPTGAGHPRVVVLTMVRDESDMLPRWIDYYGRQVGVRNLVVLDDNSVDGSTDDLPCTVYKVPPPPWSSRWAKMRARLVNGMTRGLLACNDVVIYTDVDEFLVPDPATYDGLLDYLARRAEVPVIAPLAFEVMHNPRVEPPLDRNRAVLEQRRFVKFSPAMCKPLVKRVPAPWEPAFHAIHAPFDIDPDLFLLHLKYYDEEALERVAEHRYRIRTSEGRGSPRSFWSKSPDTLKRMLSGWTSGDEDGGSVPPLDVGELDFRHLVTSQPDGSWRPEANQVDSLDQFPLRQLPGRFRGVF